MSEQPRVLHDLSRDEALRRLASVSMGRVVFTDRALPAIRPVNHLVDGGDVIIRSHLGAALMRAADSGVVVAFEADRIDAEQRLGWSVIVTGMARRVSDPAEIERFQEQLKPWIQRPEMPFVVRIQPELVTGFELVPAPQLTS